MGVKDLYGAGGPQLLDEQILDYLLMYCVVKVLRERLDPCRSRWMNEAPFCTWFSSGAMFPSDLNLLMTRSITRSLWMIWIVS